MEPPASTRLKQAVLSVAVLNLAYFGVEFSVAREIGSVSLFADSIDFLEDTSVNLLVLVALGWRRERRALLGFLSRSHSSVSAPWSSMFRAQPSPPAC